eukprot:gene447-3783_t
MSEGLPLSLIRAAVNHPMDGDRFWKVSECYIRGNNIKYLRLPDEVIDMAMQSEKRPRGGRKTRGRGGARGKVSSRGRGRGE